MFICLTKTSSSGGAVGKIGEEHAMQVFQNARACRLLADELKLMQLSARWVPHLSPEEKQHDDGSCRNVEKTLKRGFGWVKLMSVLQPPDHLINGMIVSAVIVDVSPTSMPPVNFLEQSWSKVDCLVP